MTVTNQNSKVTYVGNGSTLIFAYTFKIFETSDLVVSTVVIATGVETILTETSQYTVSGAGNPGGGNVTFLIAAPTAAQNVVIRRSVPLTQETDYVENDPFPAESHEEALDRLTFITQQLQEQIDRCVTAPVNSVIDLTLPAPEAGAAIGWNDTADGLTNNPSGIDSKVRVDAAATADYIGATAGVGVIRVNTTNLTKTDGGDFVTLDTVQSIAVTASPVFNGLTLSSLTMTNSITSISIDGTLAAPTNSQLISALAVKTYVDAQVAGIDTFLELTDTPATFVAQSLKFVRVNAGETALEFASAVPGATLLSLTDGPGTYVGHALKDLRVNAGETGFEFYTPASGGGGKVFSTALMGG